MSEGGIRLGVRRTSGGRRFGVPQSSAVRRPVAVGTHYPGDPGELASTIGWLLDGTTVPSADRLAQAYIVPHAKLVTAGALAARAYARLRAHVNEIDHVIVLGPSHTPETQGCVVTRARAFATPLGECPVDRDVIAMLERDGHVRVDSDLHNSERSLEVQVPFLQVALPGVPIVPLIVAATGSDDVVVTISAILEYLETRAGGPNRTVIVASAELSGGPSNDRTMDAVFDLAPSRIGIRDVCGAYTLRGVLGWAAHHDLHAELLGADNGYIACALHDWLTDER
jgi:MEMO1 family protein